MNQKFEQKLGQKLKTKIFQKFFYDEENFIVKILFDFFQYYLSLPATTTTTTTNMKRVSFKYFFQTNETLVIVCLI